MQDDHNPRRGVSASPTPKQIARAQRTLDVMRESAERDGSCALSSQQIADAAGITRRTVESDKRVCEATGEIVPTGRFVGHVRVYRIANYSPPTVKRATVQNCTVRAEVFSFSAEFDRKIDLERARARVTTQSRKSIDERQELQRTVWNVWGRALNWGECSAIYAALAQRMTVAAFLQLVREQRHRVYSTPTPGALLNYLAKQSQNAPPPPPDRPRATQRTQNKGKHRPRAARRTVFDPDKTPIVCDICSGTRQLANGKLCPCWKGGSTQ